MTAWQFVGAMVAGCLVSFITGIAVGFRYAIGRVAKIAIDSIRRRIESRLDAHLSEMKPNHDDSIVGFNEAWDVMRENFDAARRSLP